MDDRRPLPGGRDWLEQMGLAGLAPATAIEVQARLREELEVRTGSAIVERLDEEHLAEFEVLMQREDEAAMEAWLERRVPDYRAIVREQHRILTDEIRSGAAAIVAAYASTPEVRA